MLKLIKKKKAIIIFTSLTILFFIGFITLGYWYSKSSIRYDITHIGKQVSNLNYSMNSGDVNQITTPVIEGLVSTSLDLSKLQDDFVKNTDPISDDEKIETIFLSYSDFESAEFDKLNENEKALVILANSGVQGMDKAKKIFIHFRPITFIGDDESLTDKPTLDGYSIPSLSYGVSSSIYTNPDYSSYRLRLRDGSSGGNRAFWENGDPVLAEDFVFGISRQIPIMYSSRNTYMLKDFSDIKGMDEAMSAESEYTQIEPEYNQRFDIENNDNGIGYVGYGLMPKSRLLFQKNEEFVDFNTDATSENGIIYHDAKNPSSADYSYIQFNLKNGSKSFPTMLSSQCYLPINMDWSIKTLGYGFKMNKFGINEDSFLSNSAFKITKFDNLYGYTFEKNQNYWDSEIVNLEKGSYRMMTEASTEIAMFQNGDASSVDATDGTNKILSDNEEVSKWLKPKFISPQTKYIFFNLGTNNSTESAKFIKDPNFRRAIYYAFDKTIYHTLAGFYTTQPTSVFSPANLYSDAPTGSGDFINYATDVTYTNKGSETEELKLETYDLANRTEALSNPSIVDKVDPNQNIELANYYWNVFLDDMNQLGVNIPETIELRYLTSAGDKDPLLKTLQQCLQNEELDFFNKVKIIPMTTTSADFWTQYYQGTTYDISSLIWLPDYLDVWSSLLIFNTQQLSRNSNSTANWTYWDGSDYSIDDKTYGSAENAELARDLFDDGLSAFFEKDDSGNITSNLKSINYESHYSNTLITETNFDNTINTLANTVILDNEISISDPNVFFNSEERVPLESGLDHSKHSEIFNDPSLSLLSHLLLEVLIKDSAVALVGVTETASTTPSRVILEGDPVIGFTSKLCAVDITRIRKDSFWYPAKDDILRLLSPD